MLKIPPRAYIFSLYTDVSQQDLALNLLLGYLVATLIKSVLTWLRPRAIGDRLTAACSASATYDQPPLLVDQT